MLKGPALLQFTTTASMFNVCKHSSLVHKPLPGCTRATVEKACCFWGAPVHVCIMFFRGDIMGSFCLLLLMVKMKFVKLVLVIVTHR